VDASETIRDAARVEVGCDGTARCAANLDAALDVRAQRLSPCSHLRPIDLGLLLMAKLGAGALAAAMACLVRSLITQE
jgi:hypothetical protein